MKTILVPTDYSVNARKAILFALELAKPLQARLLLFHAYQVPDIMPAVPRPRLPSHLIGPGERKRMQALVARVRRRAGENISIEGIVAFGSPVDTLTHFIKGNRVDLVVMGTRGANNLLDRLMGTTSAALMKLAACPVLAIPLHARFKGFKEIIYASDHSSLQAVFSSFLLDLAKTFAAELVVLNIKEGRFAANRMDKTVPEAIQRNYPYTRYQFLTVVSENPEKAIADFVSTSVPQLLAVTVRERGFWEGLFHQSVLKQLANHPQVPLLALPEEQVARKRPVNLEAPADVTLKP
jgi:nucleotide-binding universal stress UspA family protein